MREDPGRSHVPVVVITALQVKDAQFERDHPVALLRKPFEPGALVATVKAMLTD